MRTLTTPTRPRQLAKLLVTAAVAASLTVLGACGKDDPAPKGSPSASAKPTSSATKASPSASPSASVKPSSNLDGITVKGDYGDKPTISFKHPWAINKTQSKVLKKGSGEEVLESGSVTVNYVGVDGRTGKTFDSSFANGKPVSFPMNGVIAGFKTGLVGKHVGDRVLIAMTGPDGYDSSGGNPQAGINVGDSLIFVVDIEATTLKSAEGKENKPKSGLPTVAMKDDKPTVTIPKSDPPTKTTVEPLITGTGAKVASTDNVTTRSVTVLWKNGKVVDDSWAKPFAPQQDPSTGAFVPERNKAMQKAMVGQTVGSRVVMVFPPKTAYKYEDRTQGIGPDDTVVMVVDILFSQAGQ
ncbi:FKBP-type peptidyl-prolyl cis-trans isomerase [Microlunatus soli]|uniref:peptidylprolyl isomerase n=1 Tax=Microlunatus soli TaxID=630515 RepID=A0A1H1Y014_9ACTN|nr:FKBP-type peptidyl-prolyl cis-trans isomerase [Microlunatus soli]SDT14838.1 peptidylprolyl isomerase [Microlunatus soli]